MFNFADCVLCLYTVKPMKDLCAPLNKQTNGDSGRQWGHTCGLLFALSDENVMCRTSLVRSEFQPLHRYRLSYHGFLTPVSYIYSYLLYSYVSISWRGQHLHTTWAMAMGHTSLRVAYNFRYLQHYPSAFASTLPSFHDSFHIFFNVSFTSICSINGVE